MAITIPIVTEFADKGLKSAEAGFNNLKAKVAEAEGGVNKMKAGFGAATDYMKANAATFAATAGSALVGFAIKGIGAFQDLALEAGKFSDATGLAVDDASRWIEVAGDIGVEASTVQTSLNKLNKEIAGNREEFKKLGIEIAYTKDGATDVNQTFLNVIDRLKAIKDPAERARVATQLLGKGWTDMAELIQMGSADLKKSLDSVSGTKVIDEKELQKARDFREAQDNLRDAIEELSLKIGETLIPVLTDAANAAMPLIGNLDKLKWGFEFTQSPLKSLWNGFKDLVGWSDQAGEKFNQLGGFMKIHIRTITDTAFQIARLGTTIDRFDTDTNGLIDTWDKLLGRLNETTAFNNVKDSLDNVYEAAGRALEEKTPAAARAAQDAVNALYGDVADYITLLGNIPADKQTQILALLDKGKYDEVMRLLDQLTRERTVKINVSGGAPVRPGDTPSESRGRGVNVVGPDGRSYYIPPGLDFSGLGKMSTKSVDLTSGGGSGNRPTVMVNVQGSVTSEKDLVETIRRGLVNLQRNGAQLVYSNT